MATAVPIREYRRSERIPEFTCGVNTADEDVDILPEELTGDIAIPFSPYVKHLDNSCFFGVVQNEEARIILGPVCFGRIAPYALQQTAIKYRIPINKFRPVAVAPRTLYALLCHLHFVLSGEMLSESVLARRVNFSAKEVTNDTPKELSFEVEPTVTNFDSKSFYSQINFLDKIKNGDAQGLVNLIEVGTDYELPNQVADSWEKNLEYLVCSAITLATQAAIDGGLSYVKAHELNTVYLHRLEQCRTAAEYAVLNFDMKKGFAEAVSEIKERPSALYSDKINRYLAKNLTNPITLKDVAAYFAKDAAYLERKFKEETGTGIMRALRNSRIEKAAQLLRKTNYPILYISELFCFSSQSHFGCVFKQTMNCTPQQYRSKYNR